MSQQPGYPSGTTPYTQPPTGQYTGYTGAPGYVAPAASAYGTSGAPQAPPYGTASAPQTAPYGTPGAAQTAPYGTPGAAQTAPYGTPGAPQAASYGTTGAPQAASYSAPQAQPYTTPGATQPTPYSTSGIPQTTPYGAVGAPQQAAYGALPGTQAPVPASVGSQYGAPDPMWASFSAVAGADQTIDAVELCKCLSQSGFTGSYKPFTQETCKILISLLDRNNTGKMDFSEYKELWVVLGKWKQTFESLDKDRSGSLDQEELQSAVVSFGYRLSSTALKAVMKRYNTNGKVYFDDFIALTTRIRALSNYFMSRDTNRQGSATLAYDDFMTHAMAC